MEVKITKIEFDAPRFVRRRLEKLYTGKVVALSSLLVGDDKEIEDVEEVVADKIADAEGWAVSAIEAEEVKNGEG